MKKTNQEIEELFKKYLKGNSTASELDELLDHFKIDDPRQLSHYIRNIFDSTIPTQIDIDTVSAITESVHKELMNHVNIKQKYSFIKRWQWVAVAAIALFTIGISIYNYTLPTEDVILVSEFGSDILPGGNRAHITFSNGEKLNLDSSQKGLIYKNGKYSYVNGKEISASHAEYATINTPVGGMYEFTLPDGTKAWLNTLSSITYPSQFSAHERVIEISGEVYLEVAPNKNRPFIVNTKKQRIEVIGTSFNIKEYGQQSITTLTHGKIKLSSADKQNTLTLTAGEQATLTDGKIAKATVDTDDYIAWKDGIIIQRNANIQEICLELEHWYDVKFKFAKGYNNKERAFHIINRNEMLSSVLIALKNTYRVNFEIKGKEVFVQ